MSTPALSSVCRHCHSSLLKPQYRAFTTTIRSLAQPQPPVAPTRVRVAQETRTEPTRELRDLAQQASNEAATRPRSGISPTEHYHLNVYSHKHNTHITFSQPSRDPILSFSCGNIGLRKSHRSTFDAAYQLACYTFRKMAEKNWRLGQSKTAKGVGLGAPITLNDPNVKERGIEVILRGYGNGREAFQKAILGPEGRMVKGLVQKVTDGTRLKFGGARSPAVRRLG